MEITVKEFQYIELITIKGRVDSVEAPRLAQALEEAAQRGRYKIVIDMSQLEYMSSAGFRALGDAQRNSKRHNRGEVVLAQVPENIREALDLVGFTEYFHLFDSVTSAFEFAENLPADDSATDT
ncbi:MAG: STAS domain-containing protein [Anaerolineae bacterium]|nr:STAS domain-containing protein [Anaerolineae bacterium]